VTAAIKPIRNRLLLRGASRILVLRRHPVVSHKPSRAESLAARKVASAVIHPGEIGQRVACRYPMLDTLVRVGGLSMKIAVYVAACPAGREANGLPMPLTWSPHCDGWDMRFSFQRCNRTIRATGTGKHCVEIERRASPLVSSRVTCSKSLFFSIGRQADSNLIAKVSSWHTARVYKHDVGDDDSIHHLM
jgi:hypothetical protein